jgi:hypothetical protein
VNVPLAILGIWLVWRYSAETSQVMRQSMKLGLPGRGSLGSEDLPRAWGDTR